MEATKRPPLQFGRDDGRPRRDRPAAFGVAERGGLIAVVNVRRPGADFIDLPGGGVDPGEHDLAAVVRELGEETGLVVRVEAPLARAAQYSVLETGEPVNNLSGFYALAVLGEDAALKIEADHHLLWLDPLEALRRLRHDSHAWAVSNWLRR